MKSWVCFFMVTLMFVACSSRTTADEECDFLLNLGVMASLNLNLPQYNPLNFPSNPVYVPNIGNAGVIVTNTGTGYVAYDAADPNHIYSNCSKLIISGIEGICGCDEGNTYDLFTGQARNNPSLRCGLKAYFAERSGNTIVISN
jgi:nitrite reductase/ring-hydroxylating ferredoxin subunit